MRDYRVVVGRVSRSETQVQSERAMDEESPKTRSRSRELKEPNSGSATATPSKQAPNKGRPHSAFTIVPSWKQAFGLVMPSWKQAIGLVMPSWKQAISLMLPFVTLCSWLSPSRVWQRCWVSYLFFTCYGLARSITCGSVSSFQAGGQSA